MLKRFLFLFLAVPFFAAAQEITVTDFYMDVKDLTANGELTKRIDDNGEICALIRIETTHKGFSYDGGTIGVVEVNESKVGEVWVYVPAGLARITLRHPQLGTLRDYYFPERLSSARTYVMKLKCTGSKPDAPLQSTASLNKNPDIVVENGTLVYVPNNFRRFKIGNDVMRIGNRAFSECTSLYGVSIPESVTEIGFEAFKGCEKLDSITIPSSVEIIGESAFEKCTELKYASLGNGLQKIGKRAFAECLNLKRIQIPGSVTYFGEYAFAQCYNLISVTMQNGLTQIGQHAFEKCSSLKNAFLPNSVKTIGAYSFSGCRQLTGITIPDGVTAIEQYAFNESGLTSVILPEGLTEITEGAFADCDLRSLTIPKTVTKIGYGAFAKCDIEELTVPGTVKIIGVRAFVGSYMKKVVVEEGVTTLEDRAFSGCSCCSNFRLPASVTHIGEEVFYRRSGICEPYIYVPKECKARLKKMIPMRQRKYVRVYE